MYRCFYVEFHLTGIHYFTVSCVLVPSLTVLYIHMRNGRGSEKLLIAKQRHKKFRVLRLDKVWHNVKAGLHFLKSYKLLL